MKWKCPKCGEIERLLVVVGISADLIQDGNGDFSTEEARNTDHEWDHNSVMTCRACGNDDISEEFQVPEEKELNATHDLLKTSLAVLDLVESEGRDTGMGDAFSDLRDAIDEATAENEESG